MSRQPDDGSWEEEAMFHMSAEIESLQDQLKRAYCKEIGSDSIVGLDSCDNYKDWLLHLEFVFTKENK